MSFFLQDAIWNISHTYSRDQTEDPLAHELELAQEEVQASLAEAQTRLSFTLLLPQYLPPNVKLSEVRLVGADPITTVKLIYTGDSGAIVITARKIAEDTGAGVGYDSDDSKVETVDINGMQGTLLLHKDSKSVLMWYQEGVAYQINGGYAPNEILKMAKSFAPTGT